MVNGGETVVQHPIQCPKSKAVMGFFLLEEYPAQFLKWGVSFHEARFQSL
jgi:hypothetical protein